MTAPRILIACVGNIFLGDDGFGTEVARRLANHSLPPEVLLKDFGIRGLDLAYALLDPYELIILVDACGRGGEPGTVYLVEPPPTEPEEDNSFPTSFDTHGMSPMNVMRMVRSMGGAAGRVLVVGCEPAELGMDEEGKFGLSGLVEAAVDEAIGLIETLVSRTLSGEAVGSALRTN